MTRAMRHVWPRWLCRALFGAALLLSGAAHALDVLPPMADLHADGQQVKREGKPLVLFFSLPGCAYCEVVRRNYLLPLLRDAAPDQRPIIREAGLDSGETIVAIDGGATTPKQLAARYHVRVAPTVVLVDSEGKLLTEPLVGGDTSGMYGAYLDNAFDEARRKIP
jgi:thioredoxin-related protein